MLVLAAEGRTNKQIAAQLYLSRHTVDYYLRRLYSRFGVRSRQELAGVLPTS